MARRFLHTVGLLVVILLVTIASLVIGARLYFSDARLQSIAQQILSERLESNVRIGGLSTSLRHGIVVTDLSVGAPTGFHEPVLICQRAALHWRLRDLLQRQVTITTLALEGIAVHLEEDAHGNTNVGMLQKAWEKHAGSSPVPPPPSQPSPLQQPHFPIAVRVESITVRIDEITAKAPQQTIDARGLSLQGHVYGKNDTMDLLLQLGLNGPAGQTRFEMDPTTGSRTLKQSIEFESNAQITITAAHLNNIGLTAKADTHARVMLPTIVSNADLHANFAAHIDAIAGALDLSHADLTVGKSTSVHLVAAVEHINAVPSLHVSELKAHIDLAELAPYAASWVHDLKARGTISAELQPMTLNLPDQRPAQGATGATSASSSVQLPDATVHINLQDISVSAATHHMDNVQASLTATRYADGTLLAKAHGHAGRIQVAAGPNVRNASILIDVEKQPDGLTINTFKLTWPTVIKDVTMRGSIGQLSSRRPTFHHVTADLRSLNLATASNVLSRVQRNQASQPMQLEGVVDARIALDGPLALARLKEPRCRITTQVWAQQIDASYQCLQDWLTVLTNGAFPQTHLHVTGHQIGYHDHHNRVHAMNLDVDVQLRNNATLTTAVAIKQIQGAMSAQNLALTFSARIDNNTIASTTSLTADSFTRTMSKPTAAAQPADTSTQEFTNAKLNMAWRYIMGGDLHLDQWDADLPSMGFSSKIHGVIRKPLRAVMERAWEQPMLPNVTADMTLQVTTSQPMQHGSMALNGNLGINRGITRWIGTLHLQDISGTWDTLRVDTANGDLPMDIGLVWGPDEHAIPLLRDLPVGGGTLALLVKPHDDTHGSTQSTSASSYYTRIDPYQQRSPITVRKITVGAHTLSALTLDAQVISGMLSVDRLQLNVLGGDVVGSLGLQLADDARIYAAMDVRVSGMDASYFPALHLTPGPDSEMNADVRAGLILGPHQRDISLNMNVTRIGSKTLDRFLQLLDPQQQDAKLQDQRKKLQLVTIRSVGVWLRYDNLYVDLDSLPLLRIPFTHVGIPQLERELIRRRSMADTLDQLMLPTMTQLGTYLGWDHGL